MFKNNNLELRDLFQAQGNITVQINNNQPNAKNFIIPFKVSKNELVDTAINKICAGFLTPDNILQSIKDNEFFGLYIPIYSLKGSFEAYLTYTAIYNITETETENNKDANEKPISTTLRTKTTQNKEPIHEESSGLFTELVVGTNLLEFIDADFNSKKLDSFCEKSDIDESKEKIFQDEDLKDFPKVYFSIYKNEAEVKVKERILKKLYKHNKKLQGDSQEKIDLKAEINISEIKKYYLPFWLFIYSHVDKRLLLAMDGNDARRVFYDNRPKDWLKIFKLFLTPQKYYSIFLFLFLVYLSFDDFAILFDIQLIKIKSILGLFAIVFLVIGLYKSYSFFKDLKNINLKNINDFKKGMYVLESESKNEKKYYISYHKSD